MQLSNASRSAAISHAPPPTTRSAYNYDNVVPDLDLTAPDATWSYSETPSFAFTTSDDDSGVASMECSCTESQAYAACTSPKSCGSSLPYGSHDFSGKLTDLAGKSSEEASGGCRLGIVDQACARRLLPYG